MGDCLILTGPVRALKEAFPGFRVSVLVEERFAPCFRGNPDFNEIIPVASKFNAAARLAARRFSLKLNLHGGPTSLFYAWMPWGRRVGIESHQYPGLYRGLVPAVTYPAHAAEQLMFTFRWLGVDRETCPPLRFEKQREEAERMRAAMKERPYAVIHPGSLFATKRWAVERFALLGQALRQRGLGIAVACGPGEEALAAAVAQGNPGAAILLGLTIAELGELIRGAALYAGNDSGPMHLAAAVGTPAVVPWGSSNSVVWRPWSVAHRVVQNDFECNPCAGYRCLVADSPLCIESVTAAQVASAARELLDAAATASDAV
jgi:ADP-heptose:LPS heptosyltransferase